MKDATHFIEIYKDEKSNTVNQSLFPLSIKNLHNSLNTTFSLGMKTLFIWKIKLK